MIVFLTVYIILKAIQTGLDLLAHFGFHSMSFVSQKVGKISKSE